MAELILVKAADCRPLRAAILRPGRPAADSEYPHDDDERAMHFAMKDGDEVLGVASLLPEPRRAGVEAWRMRGVAVRAERRGQGLGTTLVQAVQAVAGQRGGGLWCGAPEAAEPFYARHGFARTDEVIEPPGDPAQVVLTWHPHLAGPAPDR